MVKLGSQEKERKMEAMKYVVIDEHTLGYEILEINSIGILHGLVLKGGFDSKNGSISRGQAIKIRNATREDFETFKVKVPPDFQEN